MAIGNDIHIGRKNVIITLMVIVFVVYILRLLQLQIFDETYKNSADNNAFLHKTRYPARGLIYDRNGKLLVYNKPAYDVMVIINEVHDLDTIDFCRTVNITKDQFCSLIEKMKRQPGYTPYTPQQLIAQLSIEEYAVLQEKLFRFPGFYIQDRTLREYTYPCAAHALGYVSEVTEQEIEENPYYKRGDYIGRSGIEKQYESVLCGIKGYEILLRDSRGRLKGKYQDGKLDRASVSGKNIQLSLDIELQQYGEKLMQNKIGSVVAIEPSTGEVLAFVASPAYNPSDLVGRDRSRNFPLLNKNPLKPLLDRPLQARYPPGSTFKVLNSLIFQHEGVITPATRYGCAHGFSYGGLHVGCHGHPSPLDMRHSLQTSCNGYYCHGLHDMLDTHRRKYGSVQEALNTWKNHVVSFGFGYKTGIDLPHENRGYIPNASVYDKVYGTKGWSGVTIISIAIGQGEVLATPIQEANYVSAIANHGWWITPHVVKKIYGDTIPSSLLEKHVTSVDPKFFDASIDGMEMAVQGGTARVAQLPGVRVCAKTGTAQNPHGKDHSVFIAFAPRENPKIAIAVFVENAGFGATWAGPIASLMMEKYLTGGIADNRKYLEERMVNANLIPTNPKER
jgi:penicillin-binding protein 2